jgi:hypothetical protein
MFTDGYTCFTWVYFLWFKDEALSKFKQFKSLVENMWQFKIAGLQTDRGGEYLSKAYNQFCIDSGIKHDLTCANTPFQNGVSERKNCTVLEMTQSMLLGSKLPSPLWEEATRCSVYLLNWISHKSIQMTTPFQRLTGAIPNLSHIRVFGCKVSVLLTKKGDKLASKSFPATFVGYDNQSKAYRVFDATRHKVYLSQNVQFDEDTFTLTKRVHKDLLENFDFEVLLPEQAQEPVLPSSTTASAPTAAIVQEPGNDATTQASEGNSDNVQVEEPWFPDTLSNTISPPGPIPQPPDQPTRLEEPQADRPTATILTSPPIIRQKRRRLPSPIRDAVLPGSVCSRAPSKKLRNFYCYDVEIYDFDADGLTFTQAIKLPKWQASMAEEIQSIIQNDTWKLVNPPPGIRPISCKWIYKVKEGLDKANPRYKYRLVARGFEQQEGRGYSDTVAPVVKWATIHSVSAIAGACRWKIYHLDVKTAFLNGPI